MRERIDAVSVSVEDALCSPLRVVAVQDHDRASLARSASGGAFCVLARAVLETGGVVFGAEALPGGVVRHARIESVADLPRLQGSKYAPSDASAAFAQCADALASGREALFSGVPCLVYALRRRLERLGLNEEALSRLWTVDLICHGVPDPRLFRLYISWLERQRGADPDSLRYEFRSKQRGWGLNFHYTYERDGKRESRFGVGRDDPYYAAFLAGNLFRPVCYSCKFAREERVGDFTIGDFWGIREEHPDFDCRQGASVLLMNTERAVRFFGERCVGGCVVKESSFEAAARHNEQLVRPSVRAEAGEGLAAAVGEALDRGDADAVFGKLLRVPRDVAYFKRLATQLLPQPVVEALKALLNRA